MTKQEMPSYVVTLKPLPDPGDPGGTRRLRAVLKTLLRRYWLRCVAVTPSVPESPTTTWQNKTPQGGV